jgi:hypothetical protein
MNKNINLFLIGLKISEYFQKNMILQEREIDYIDMILKISAMLLLFFGSLIFSTMPILLKRCKFIFGNILLDHFFEVVNGFAGGVLLSGAFLHLLVESNELITSAIKPQDDHIFSYSNLICASSLFLMFTFEQVKISLKKDY